MIGRIQGRLLELHPPECLIDVGGIAYEVAVPMTTLYTLPPVGETITLYTHFVVREDAQQLYGFSDRQSRQLFRELIRVNGVGPRLGIGILSGMDCGEFLRCVAAADVSGLVKIPGIGKKTAERLLVEMSDRLKDWQASTPGSAPLVVEQRTDHKAEAEAALLALGYKPTEASKAIAAVADQAERSEDLIRLALRNMVGR